MLEIGFLPQIRPRIITSRVRFIKLELDCGSSKAGSSPIGAPKARCCGFMVNVRVL